MNRNYVIARAPAIRKMKISGRKVAQISFIPSCRRTHWKLENQCLVNFKSCKSVEIMGCILLHMTFYNAIFENEGVHTKIDHFSAVVYPTSLNLVSF